MYTPHDPAWSQSHGRIAYCPSSPLRIDRIERRHQPLRALPVVLVKEMRLHLMGWDQRGQDHPSFLVAIALAKYLLDASESIPDQLGGVLGGDGEWDGHTIGILRLIGKAIRREKDRQHASSTLCPA